METALVVAAGGVAGALVTGFFTWLGRRGETDQQRRHDDSIARRDIAAIANQQVELAFKYWQAIFDEREEDITKLLNRVKELTRERDECSDRIRELGSEVEDLKRKRRRDQETIAKLQTEIETVRQANGK